MVAQALRLRKAGKKVRVISKDVRTYTRQAEEMYEAAMRAGVQFFRYDGDLAPQEAISFADGYVQFAEVSSWHQNALRFSAGLPRLRRW
jgi:heterodisulfide reductase subunit A